MTNFNHSGSRLAWAVITIAVLAVAALRIGGAL